MLCCYAMLRYYEMRKQVYSIMKKEWKISGKLISLTLILLMLAPLFSGCKDGSLVPAELASEVISGVFPVTVGGVEITSQPTKVLVLSPSLADVIIELGDEGQLAAAADTCTQSALSTLPKISATDVSAITSADVDLVLTDPLEDSFRSALSTLTAPVVEISPAKNREDYERMFGEVSSVFKGDGAGKDLGISAAKKIFTTMDDISRAVEQNTVTTACYLYDAQTSAVTGDMFGSVIISYAGMTNVFNSQTSGKYDFSILELSNPDVIFCAPGVKDEILSEARFQELQAVQDKRVFEVEPYYMEWQGRTVIQAALKLAENAFPELVEESEPEGIDPTSKIEKEVNSEFGLNSSEENTSYETLEPGSSGDEVYALQERLTELGYLKASFNGDYGSFTEEAVKAFQKDHKMAETGIADEETQRAIYGENANDKAQTNTESESSESSESSNS